VSKVWTVLKMVCITAVSAALSHCASTPSKPPPTVAPKVEISRYLGQWYDIAHLPFRFQKNCWASTASYSMRPDGDIAVVNSCREGGFDGPKDSVTGKARVVDPVTNAKLEVQFFWPFWGDYWIVDLDPDYHWALVGTPSYKYLWILHRQPVIDKNTYDDLVRRAREKGYAVEKLIRSPQQAVQ